MLSWFHLVLTLSSTVWVAGLSSLAQHILFSNPQLFHMLFLGAHGLNFFTEKNFRSQMKESLSPFQTIHRCINHYLFWGPIFLSQFIEKPVINMSIFLKTASSFKTGFSCAKSCIFHGSSYNILKPIQLRYFNDPFKAQEGTGQTALIGSSTWKVPIIFMLRTECSSKNDFPRILFIATEGYYWILYNRRLLLNTLLLHAYLINIYTHMPDTGHINTKIKVGFNFLITKYLLKNI